MNKASEAFRKFAANCPHRVTIEQPRRPGNALNVEHFAVAPVRCVLKRPEHWPTSVSATRWLRSGGSTLVFDACGQPCALGHEWCPECGHRKESHMVRFGKASCPVFIPDVL